VRTLAAERPADPAPTTTTSTSDTDFLPPRFVAPREH